MAIAVAYKLVSTGHKDRISGLIVMSGMFLHPDAVPDEYTDLHRSYVDNGGQVPVVTGKDMLAAYEHIVGAVGTKNLNWFPATGGAKAVAGFPPVYITNSDGEACRDDGAVLAAELKDAGVVVKRDNMLALPHYYWCFPVQKAGGIFRQTLIDGIRWWFLFFSPLTPITSKRYEKTLKTM